MNKRQNVNSPLFPKNIIQVVVIYANWLLGGPPPKTRVSKSNDSPNANAAHNHQSNSREPQQPRAIPTNIETRIGEATEIGAALEIGIRDLVDHIAPGGMQIYADCIEIVGEAWVRV
ncbi:hypothetical protein DCC62_31730, partial [candidate division KSB1 bacterium]